MNQTSSFSSSQRWGVERPHILIVACSDGRYQLGLDEFLETHLGITYYDRLYAPGGPGALASSTYSFMRGEQFRQESLFLASAHLLDEVVLIFHGPAPDGPPEATCADYLRKMPYCSPEEILRQQSLDLKEVVAAFRRADREIGLRAFRAEVRADSRIQFVPMLIE